MGRSNRKKIIKKDVIINSINSDRFSKRDFYIRKKINELGISPKIHSYSTGYFIEELVSNYKTSYSSAAVSREVLLFKNMFKTIEISKKKYIDKLLFKIDKYSTKIASELIISDKYKTGHLIVTISHGDLIHKNIMVTSKRKFIIDFEFCSYRSEFYDEYYEKYYINRDVFFNENITDKIIIFNLERLLLILSLQSELDICYENEIKVICNHLKNRGMDC